MKKMILAMLLVANTQAFAESNDPREQQISCENKLMSTYFGTNLNISVYGQIAPHGFSYAMSKKLSDGSYWPQYCIKTDRNCNVLAKTDRTAMGCPK